MLVTVAEASSYGGAVLAGSTVRTGRRGPSAHADCSARKRREARG
jgi:hypothetical protein